MNLPTTLPELRRELVHARSRLRQLDQQLDIEHAYAEQHAIELVIAAGKTIGSNAEDRKRNLIIALAENHDVQGLVAKLEVARNQIDWLEAEIKIAEAKEKALRVQVDDKLAMALLCHAPQDVVREVMGQEADALLAGHGGPTCQLCGQPILSGQERSVDNHVACEVEEAARAEPGGKPA